MALYPEQLANHTAATGSETKDPNTEIMCAHATRRLIHTEIQEYVHPDRFLAIGQQDLNEVIRQDREDYEANERYETELKQQLSKKYWGHTAIIHTLQIAPEITQLAQNVQPVRRAG